MEEDSCWRSINTSLCKGPQAVLLAGPGPLEVPRESQPEGDLPGLGLPVVTGDPALPLLFFNLQLGWTVPSNSKLCCSSRATKSPRHAFLSSSFELLARRGEPHSCRAFGLTLSLRAGLCCDSCARAPCGPAGLEPSKPLWFSTF